MCCDKLFICKIASRDRRIYLDYFNLKRSCLTYSVSELFFWRDKPCLSEAERDSLCWTAVSTIYTLCLAGARMTDVSGVIVSVRLIFAVAAYRVSYYNTMRLTPPSFCVWPLLRSTVSLHHYKLDSVDDTLFEAVHNCCDVFKTSDGSGINCFRFWI